MMIENARLGAAMRIGAAVSPGICQLKADQQVLVGPGRQAMLFDQRSAQVCEASLGMRRRHQLIGIGASFV